MTQIVFSLNVFFTIVELVMGKVDDASWTERSDLKPAGQARSEDKDEDSQG